MTKHCDQATWGGEGLFGLHLHITVYYQKKSGQELKHLEVAADAEAMEGHCLQACFSWLAQSAFF